MLEAVVEKIKLNELGKKSFLRHGETKSPVTSKSDSLFTTQVTFYARGTDWGKEMKLNELETFIFEAELLAVGEA